MKTSIKVISLFLSFWMFMVSTGFTLNRHYCDGILEDWSIVSEANACKHHEEKKEDTSCCNPTQKKEVLCTQTNHNHPNNLEIEGDCCDTNSQTIILNEAFSFDIYSFSLPLVLLIFKIYNFSPVSTNKYFNLNNYLKKTNLSPTHTVKDIPVFIQSFLI